MTDATRKLLALLGIDVPLIQAPMAGVSTPAMAAAASNAGALGSIGIGAANVEEAARMIDAVRAETSRAFNVNVFCHRPARSRIDVERAWIDRLRPTFEEFGAEPPKSLSEIYPSFLVDDAMLAMLIERKPPIVSFHFGIPDVNRLRALRDARIVLMGTATSSDEARALVDAGITVIVAQGFEAGGHRGVFDPDAHDEKLDTYELTRRLMREFDVPVVAAGGLMTGADIAAVLKIGAAAAQLGTAFVACDESQADTGFRAALFSDAAHRTTMTRAISGRPARCLRNRFTKLGESIDATTIPDYPIAYDAGKALHIAARRRGEFGYGAQWAGQGAPRARKMSTRRLVETLIEELRVAELS